MRPAIRSTGSAGAMSSRWVTTRRRRLPWANTIPVKPPWPGRCRSRRGTAPPPVDCLQVWHRDVCGTRALCHTVRDVAPDGVVKAWLTLPAGCTSTPAPCRPCTTATLWENEWFEPLPRDMKVPGLADEVDALRNILLVDEHAHFEFAATEASCARSRPATSGPTHSGSTTFSTVGWCRPRVRSRSRR